MDILCIHLRINIYMHVNFQCSIRTTKICLIWWMVRKSTASDLRSPLDLLWHLIETQISYNTQKFHNYITILWFLVVIMFKFNWYIPAINSCYQAKVLVFNNKLIWQTHNNWQIKEPVFNLMAKTMLSVWEVINSKSEWKTFYKHLNLSNLTLIFI